MSNPPTIQELFESIASDDVTNLRQMIKAGADLYECTENGTTILDWALRRRSGSLPSAEIIATLIEYGAGKMWFNNSYEPSTGEPIMYAHFLDHKGREIVKSLSEESIAMLRKQHDNIMDKLVMPLVHERAAWHSDHVEKFVDHKALTHRDILKLYGINKLKDVFNKEYVWNLIPDKLMELAFGAPEHIRDDISQYAMMPLTVAIAKNQISGPVKNWSLMDTAPTKGNEK